jgi:Uma2 family endonuclease
MSSIELPKTLPFQPVRLSVLRYHELVQAGAFSEHDAVELLEGVVVEKMPKNPPHRLATRKCDLLLSRLCPLGWHVQNQEPITLENSEPEPDVAIVRGRLEDYVDRHPLGHEIELVVEVADTSLVTDRYKAELYAEAKIPSYWLINLIDRCIEVMSQPTTLDARSTYSKHQIFKLDEQVPVWLADQAVGIVSVSDILR